MDMEKSKIEQMIRDPGFSYLPPYYDLDEMEKRHKG